MATKKTIKPILTANSLFQFALSFAESKQESARMFTFPTLKEASNHFKVSMKAIEETCDDECMLGYLGVIVGFKNGMGYGNFGRAERQIEAVAS